MHGKKTILNDKIIKILRTFSSEDSKNFKKFLASPFFTKGRDLSKYYEVLMKFSPDFEIEKKKFLKLYFGKQEDDEGKLAKIIRALNSDLIKALEDFLCFTSLKNMDYYSRLMLIEEYSYRGLIELGEEAAKEAIGFEEQYDPGYIQELQKILLYNSYSNFKSLLNKNTEIYDLMEIQSENLISLFFSMSTQLLNSLKINPRNFKIEKNTEQLSNLLKNIDFENFQMNLRDDFPLASKVKLDIALIKILLDAPPSEDLNKELNKIYSDAYDELDHRDKMNYFISILNHYTAHSSEEMIKIKLEFIKFGLTKGLFPSGSVRYLSNANYKIFLIAGLHAKEIDWAEKYAEEYLNKINPDFKENLSHYTKAYIHHYKKEYIQSLDEVNLFQFGNEFLTYDMKLMQLKNFYELIRENESYIENLNAAIDAFRHFLSDNKKVSESYRESGKQFIKGLRALLKHSKEQDNFEIKKIKQGSLNNWLRDKADELILK